MSHFDIMSRIKSTTPTQVTRSTNLMCALLNNITYNDLYESPFWRPGAAGEPGDPNCALERMRSNAANLPDELNTDPDGSSYDVRARITTLLDAIREILNPQGTPPVHLRGLFIRNVSLGASAEDPFLLRIHDLIAALRTNTGDNLHHFCTPFMEMQKSNNYPVMQTDWNEFIAVCGRYTLVQLFANVTRASVGSSIHKAKRLGIMTDQGRKLSFTFTNDEGESSTVYAFAPNGGNSLKCYIDAEGDHSCVASFPYHWCNLTDDDVCSAMSD